MQDLLKSLEQNQPAAIALLEQMVNMDSPSTDKQLVDRFGRFVGSNLEALGGRVDYVHADRYGDHLLARFSGKSSRSILILGHLDTVFSPGDAGRRPFAIKDGRASGPGVFDMKAGIVLVWSAIRALVNLPRPVTVLLTSDEEVGSPSSRDLIESEAAACAAVLVLEPSLPGGALKTARKGVGRFTVKANGRAAHAGIDPSRGVNAIEEIAHQILRLQGMSDTARGTTVTVGVVQGGSRVNVVPAEAAVDIDVRISNNNEALRISEAIRTLQPHMPGASLHVRGGINRPPMERSADIVKLYAVARQIGIELGVDIQEGATGGASDGNFTAALGIPTLDGLGAIGDGAHSIDEYIDVDSLPLRSALLAGLITRV